MDYEILKKKVKLEVTNDEQAREFEKLHNVKVKKGRTNYVLYRSKNYSIEERSDIIVDTRIIMSKQDYDYFMSFCSFAPFLEIPLKGGMSPFNNKPNKINKRLTACEDKFDFELKVSIQ